MLPLGNGPPTVSKLVSLPASHISVTFSRPSQVSVTRAATSKKSIARSNVNIHHTGSSALSQKSVVKMFAANLVTITSKNYANPVPNSIVVQSGLFGLATSLSGLVQS